MTIRHSYPWLALLSIAAPGCDLLSPRVDDVTTDARPPDPVPDARPIDNLDHRRTNTHPRLFEHLPPDEAAHRGLRGWG